MPRKVSAKWDSGGRKMGCLPRKTLPGDLPCLPLYRDHFELIPREDWEPVSMRHLIWHTFDQDGVGSCTCNAACSAVMLAREIQGLPRRVLCPGNLYGRINGGRDQGSALDDALEALAKDGVCTTDIQEPNEWRRLAPNWKVEGAHFRFLEWFDLEGNVDALFSAIQKRLAVVIGVMWPGGGGHAILAMGCKKNGSKWEAEIKNSWGSKWGEDGFGYLTQATLATMPQFGCWAGRVATSSDGP